MAVAEEPHPGYELLLNKPYLTYDFDEETFVRLWDIWPEPDRSQAEQLSPRDRRQLIFKRYGLTPRPGADLDSETTPPLQYVVDASGKWTMNCFTCHGGSVMGKVVPGAPNTRFALQSLSEDLWKLKTQLMPEKPLTRMERAQHLVPLGTTRGTTNAVMFGVGLLALRDGELNMRPVLIPPRMVHHDLDAPAWWVFHKKTHLYAEGYAPKGHRSLMQFALIRSNGPEKFREWEPDFQEIAAYLDSLRPPRYPLPIDQPLARRGAVLFAQNCAECHGTYGDQSEFPSRVIPLSEIGTDPVRFTAIRQEERELFHQSWFGHHGEAGTVTRRDGYLAPPLDGIWASAPYFHNGSVPTLWHLLHPAERPRVWRQTDPDQYDERRGGMLVEELDRVPADVASVQERREFFDTAQFGKSSAGHLFPDVLSEEEKQAVLEYLKTL